jgi:hypothetical protein
MNSPFPIQPPVPNFPLPNPTKIMNDEMERELVSVNNQYINSKPTFVQPRMNTPAGSKTIQTPLLAGGGSEEIKEIPSGINVTPRPTVYFNDENNIELPRSIPIQSTPNNKERDRLMRNNNLFQLQAMAQDNGINLFDPITGKQRTKQILAEIIMKKK